MEAVAAACDKEPAQMGQAHGAKTDPPGIAAKPGELHGRRSGVTATLSILKTTDFIHDAVGIGESVTVGALDRNALDRSGDGLMALPAEDILLFFRRFFRGFLFDQIRCRSTLFLVGTFAQ